MKVKELIERLRLTDSDNEVYMVTESSIWEFSGVSYDDIGDVQLFVTCDDKEAWLKDKKYESELERELREIDEIEEMNQELEEFEYDESIEELRDSIKSGNSISI